MLKGSHISLIPLKKNHLEDVRKIRNDSTTNYFLTMIAPINEYMQDEWFKSLCLDGSKMYFIIEDHQANVVGLIRCDEWDKINRSIRVGIDISPRYRRKGYATEAYRLLIPYLFNHLSIHRVWLLVIDFNTSARSLYTKLGFREEGVQRKAIYRKGQFCDYIMMSLLKEEYETSENNTII